MSLVLTDWQKRARNGELGEPIRQAMEIVVELAEFWGAHRLVPVRKVHVSGVSVQTSRQAGKKYIEWCARSGAKFLTTVTVNPVTVDLARAEVGSPPSMTPEQTDINKALVQMGAITCFSCTPYLIGNLPRFGEHVAWGESSAVIYANSVLGARTNREGTPSAFAAALTGFTGEYGFHLDENRRATVHVRVEHPLSSTCDYGCVGYFAASQHPDSVPVFSGLPYSATETELKALSAALATSGAVAMFHAVGLTPEAPSLEAATNGNKVEEVAIGPREIQRTMAFLDRNDQEDVDCVMIGCPHLDYDEVAHLARLLSGRKVSSNVVLWLFGSSSLWQVCERSGLARILTDAGAHLISDNCPNVTPFNEVIKAKGIRSAATDSSKLAHYMPSWGLKIHYGPTTACIESAITGKWRV